MYATDEERKAAGKRSREKWLSVPENREKIRVAKRKNQKAKWERKNKRRRAQIDEYLNAHPCVDCGETDIQVLQFDHVFGEKSFNITEDAARAWAKVVAEIAKCEIRCANCHIRRHRREKAAA